MSSPLAKRQRTEDASTTRSSVWYKDGSIILQAADTQFRVHWGVPSQHSSFFRDLEDLPQPPDQPAVDGCVIVELQDSAVDVEHLLKALYDPTFLSQTALPLAVVGALIRLGHKYDFKNLLDSAVARLTSQNPATLEEFDALFVIKSKPTPIIIYPGYSLGMLALAREKNIGLALPFAFYLASGGNMEQFLQAVRRKDEAIPSLSLDDICRCFIGRQRLVTKQFQPGYTLGWLREWPHPPADCNNPAKCTAKRKSKFHSYMDANCVQPFLEGSQADIWKGRFCAACYEHIIKSVTAGRKKMWEELLVIFDLPPWDQLKNDL
ncbi:BTB domain-containing protein [Mycena sanguinolenta]|uniref:BTB domain-containing protein n=1 Tax=Mycena sanguinolenta TaxID=230812 RepID=A0A8H6Y314_9AGAR|nr:BTB domain-containing protein [Mycena sanguinolenta]